MAGNFILHTKRNANSPSAIPNDLFNRPVPPDISSFLLKQPSNHSACGVRSSCTREDFFRDLSTRRPVYLPASTPIYSNVGFQLLAFALEEITGRSFNDMVNESVFDVLNMESTTLGTPDSTAAGIIPVNETISGWAEAPVCDSA